MGGADEGVEVGEDGFCRQHMRVQSLHSGLTFHWTRFELFQLPMVSSAITAAHTGPNISLACVAGQQHPGAGLLLLRGGVPRHHHRPVACRAVPGTGRTRRLQTAAGGGPLSGMEMHHNTCILSVWAEGPSQEKGMEDTCTLAMLSFP